MIIDLVGRLFGSVILLIALGILLVIYVLVLYSVGAMFKGFLSNVLKKEVED